MCSQRCPDGSLHDEPSQENPHHPPFAEHNTATLATTTAICPGTDHRDFEAALGYLVEEGSLDGPTWRPSSFLALAERGCLTLTERGRKRFDEDDL